jgi:hypothetical protein
MADNPSPVKQQSWGQLPAKVPVIHRLGVFAKVVVLGSAYKPPPRAQGSPAAKSLMPHAKMQFSTV